MFGSTDAQHATISGQEYDDCIKLEIEERDGSKAQFHIEPREAIRLGITIAEWGERKERH